ncbi:6-hydroxymethylpterin diphosphokinase MptE-like protein [Paraglaciecola aquimarina]|uniref:6-hydroxymethylpterin diphosphokinase MptE-like protein n=1 Tax=Paraglaciecola aquimarina TaxID=1235557 RepID=A0ABU3T0A9_9ALTE|nr:6-hydroxymethylpterin diphosphokinase MptE-like protein [Paraglaciecola aquimarina]MDU0355698.1 6-hydroxymethylpterin diphosphokinase MptE-like protein [Paraglaciecola aquimarina]
MGEYFDHARYGICHTREVIRRGAPILRKSPAQELTADDKDVPIFIVGNGPSLDMSIPYIKENMSQAIVISCGTALMPLSKAGITPDFHAEIEQNRSTFDWCSRIGDTNYLKNISLLSCNGIHPDTCHLFKNVLIAFKDGESSTVSALNLLGEQNFEVLKHAFPTVSNLVCNLVSRIEFNNIYLIGVDLGFADVNHHHSKDSGYYDDSGQQLYDYAEKNNTSLIVAGNFRPTVNTKHEFKVSRQVIEQVTNEKNRSQVMYNCSDGAKIKGTIPLRLENILLTNTVSSKKVTIQKIQNSVFQPVVGKIDFPQMFDNQYSIDVLRDEFKELQNTVDSTKATAADIQKLLSTQKNILFNSYRSGKSLLFYLLYGTVNYANAFLSKMLASSDGSTRSLETLEKSLLLWKEGLENIAEDYFTRMNDYDSSSSFMNIRINKILQNLEVTHQVECIDNYPSETFRQAYLQLFKLPPCKSKNEGQPRELVIFGRVENNLQQLQHPNLKRIFIGSIGGKILCCITYPPLRTLLLAYIGIIGTNHY